VLLPDGGLESCDVRDTNGDVLLLDGGLGKYDDVLDEYLYYSLDIFYTIPSNFNTLSIMFMFD
jgi:hypothetical protein